jgi:hypothetical protein
LRGKRTRAQHRAEILALDEPHVHEQASVDLAEVVDRHHVGIVEPRGRPSLATETFLERLIAGQMRGQDLHRHHAVGHGVIGAPDIAHSTAAQQLDQLVAPERRAVQLNLPEVQPAKR